MFAQCTWKCASSVLLVALLSCVLSPPAHASKVSEQLLTQALNVVQQAQKWKRNKWFFMKICKGKKCCKRSVPVHAFVTSIHSFRYFSGLCPALCHVLVFAF